MYIYMRIEAWCIYFLQPRQWEKNLKKLPICSENKLGVGNDYTFDLNP